MPIILSAREAETVSSDKTSSSPLPLGTKYGVMMMMMMGANGRAHDIMMEGDHHRRAGMSERGGRDIVTLVQVVGTSG